MDPTSPSDPFHVKAILGAPLDWYIAPALIGCMLNWFLFGALTIQVYDYSARFQSTDRVGLKVVVYGVFLAEIVGTVLVTLTVWDIILGSWGDALSLINCPKSAPPNVLVNNIIALVVQLFFAWRILCLRQTILAKIGAGLVIATALFALAMSVIFVEQYIKVDDADIKTLTADMNLWVLSAFLCDSIIAIIMVSLLWKARAATSYQQTKTVINHLVVHTIETGAATAMIATIELGLFLKSPHSYLHLSMFYILGRIYSNALMAAVNGRHRMRALLDASAEHPCVTSLRLPPTYPGTGTGTGTMSYEEESASSAPSSQPGFMVLMKTTVHTTEGEVECSTKAPSSTDSHKR